MNELNPYAPTTKISETPGDFVANDLQPRSHSRVLGRWTLVCGLAAAPSFVMGFMLTGGQVLGMLFGVLFFIVLYTWTDLHTASSAWRQNQVVRRTLVTTYSIRILMTVIFPIGAYVDTISGFFAVTTIGAVSGTAVQPDEFGFGMTLLTTLVQGCYLNVILFVVGLALLPIIMGMTKFFTRGVAHPGHRNSRKESSQPQFSEIVAEEQEVPIRQ